MRQGKDAVAEFFTLFGSTMEVIEFTPVPVAANETDVLTVVRFRARSRSTGKTAEMDLHHYFKFRDGKIAHYRGTEDTAQTETVSRLVRQVRWCPCCSPKPVLVAVLSLVLLRFAGSSCPCCRRVARGPLPGW